MPSKRVVITQSMFDRVWEEEIVPDLERRRGDLTEALAAAEMTADFFNAVRDLLAELNRVQDVTAPGAEIDWDALVEPTQVLCWIARERCSTR